VFGQAVDTLPIDLVQSGFNHFTVCLNPLFDLLILAFIFSSPVIMHI